MGTVLTSGSNNGNYTPHPAGAYMAVLADVFTKDVPNKYKGSKNNRGQIDNRDTIKKLCLAFLTTEEIEINGEWKPRYASYWGSASWGTVEYPSNVRKFIKAWLPKLTDEMIESGFDLDTLIGKGAWITITHQVGRDGKTYANIVSAVTPPPGMNVPEIPSDFERHQDKQRAQAEEVASQEVDGDPF